MMSTEELWTIRRIKEAKGYLKDGANPADSSPVQESGSPAGKERS